MPGGFAQDIPCPSAQRRKRRSLHGRARGAPAIEAYPVDNAGQKVDLTMAYVGTQTLFERAGFVKTADTASVINRFPRVLMRLDLR